MTTLFWSLTAALIACRFCQFRPYLDHPHLFRQAETGFYSLGFYRLGFNILAPSVGWLGAYRRVILEFPLTEWISGSIYLLTGPTILVDRVVNLGFFLVSAFFFFRIVSLVQDQLMAQIATLLYVAAPLSIYYSRAVHIDFTAVCFAHALLYYTLRFVVSRHAGELCIAVITGTLAFVIKSPYAFYLLIPALYFCHQRRANARMWLMVGTAFAVPAVAFIGWFAYSQRVNAQAPDLSFISSHFHQINRFSWYFGTTADRLTLEPWQTVVGRVYREIAATVWWVLVPLSLLARDWIGRYYGFALSWTAGALIYLILFLSLNADHNYYQIPFIAPFSLWLAAPIYGCWTGQVPFGRWGRSVAVTLLIAYAASSMFVASRRFYRVDSLQIAIGKFIETTTSQDDLIVMAHTHAKFADPSFLFYARRYGWSVGPRELSPHVIEALGPYGASVVVTSTFEPPDAQTQSYLQTLPLAGLLDISNGQVAVHRLSTPDKRP